MSLKVSGECFVSRMNLIYSGGTAICRFSIKTSKKDKNGEWQNQWFNGVSFKDTAEKVAAYADGQRVYIEGVLSANTYEKDGEKKKSVEVVCFDISPVGDIKERTADKELVDDPLPF